MDKADANGADLAPTVREFRAGGLSVRAITGRLNADGHTTHRSAPWNAVRVARVLKRAG